MQMDGMQARNSLIYVPTQERDGNNSAGGGTAPHYHQHQHVKRPRYENSNNNNNFHRNQQNTNLMISPIPYLENPVQSINEHFGRFGRLTKVVVSLLCQSSQSIVLNFDFPFHRSNHSLMGKNALSLAMPITRKRLLLVARPIPS